MLMSDSALNRVCQTPVAGTLCTCPLCSTALEEMPPLLTHTHSHTHTHTLTLTHIRRHTRTPTSTHVHTLTLTRTRTRTRTCTHKHTHTPTHTHTHTTMPRFRSLFSLSQHQQLMTLIDHTHP